MRRNTVLILGIIIFFIIIIFIIANKGNNIIRNIIHYLKSNKLEQTIVTDDFYQWLNGKDLSGNDLTDKKEVLISSKFDTSTKWPQKDKMPQGFDPTEVMKWGKKQGLMLTELHKQGYTGEGVNIAVIDGILNRNHIEIKDNLIHYEEVQDLSRVGINFHGTAVASIATGKNIGVAPEANLYYFAIYDNPERNEYQANVAEAIKRIIQFNNNSENEKIRLVVSAKAYNRKYTGGQKYYEAVKLAQKNNVLIMQPDFNVPAREILKFYLFGSNCSYPCDKDHYNNYQIARVKKEYLEQLYVIQEITNKSDNWNTLKINLNYKLEYLENHNQGYLMLGFLLENLNEIRQKYITIDEFNYYIKEAIKYYLKESIHVPSSGITVATDKGKVGYSFEGEGGISWALPYYAGVAALALQIKPELSNDELIDLIDKTAVVNDSGLKIIAPQEVVKYLIEDKDNK